VWCDFPFASITHTFVTSDPPADGQPGPTTLRNNDCRLSRCKGLGSSLFARHTQESRFLSFLGTKMFQFTGLHYPPIYQAGHARITTRSFPFGDPGVKVSAPHRVIAAAHVFIGSQRQGIHVYSYLLIRRHFYRHYGVFKVRAVTTA